MKLTENQAAILHAIEGTQNSHYELARYCECKGFYVVGDSDDMQLSYICLKEPGKSDGFWPSVVGEIRGDGEATIKVVANLAE